MANTPRAAVHPWTAPSGRWLQSSTHPVPLDPFLLYVPVVPRHTEPVPLAGTGPLQPGGK